MIKKAMVFAGLCFVFILGLKAATITDAILQLGRIDINSLGSRVFSLGVDPSINNNLRLINNSNSDVYLVQNAGISLPTRTKAQMAALVLTSVSTGSIVGVCSDCADPYSVCQSTGVIAGQIKELATSNTTCSF